MIKKTKGAALEVLKVCDHEGVASVGLYADLQSMNLELFRNVEKDFVDPAVALDDI